MPSGIYSITCTPNGKVYVGSAVDFASRRRVHLCQLRGNKHHSVKLQRAFNKYGEGAFVFSLIAPCGKDELISVEQHYIDTIKPWFNSVPTAGSKLGSKRSEESKERMRLAQLKVKAEKGLCPVVEARRLAASRATQQTAAYKAKVSAAQKGRKHSESHIAKVAEANTGKKRSLSARLSMSESQRKRRGVCIADSVLIDAYKKLGTVRGVASECGAGRKLIKGLLIREGLL